MPSEASAERLRRILVLVPWVMARGSPTVEEVCGRFGITPEELAADIELLFVCGLPPFGPGDLIEAWIDEGTVHIGMADYLARPPRLTRTEAIALLVMGRAVAALPGVEEGESLTRALAKLAGAIAPAEEGTARGVADRVAVELDAIGTSLLAGIREAISSRARLRISYYSHGRGEMSERDIDPYVVFTALGYWYVAAQDHASDEERVFRIDRIEHAAETGETFEVPPGFDPERYASAPLFSPSARDLDVLLELSADALWMREVIAWDSIEPAAGDRVLMKLRTPHLDWLVRLLLAVGPAARPVEPPELATAVRNEAVRALALYA